MPGQGGYRGAKIGRPLCTNRRTRETRSERLAEIRAVIKKSDDTLRTARDLEGQLSVVLRDVAARLRQPRGTLNNSPPFRGGVGEGDA